MVSALYYGALTAFLLKNAQGHIKMAQPVPFSVDKVDTSPIEAADFPCKQTLGYQISQMNEMAAGSAQTITFDGTAVHGGGSCQLAVTLDKEPTADSKFKVIHSIMGGCPGVDGATDVFEYNLPAELPNGEATFAWTWFARLGGQPEMYMNCAPITITGGADDTSGFDQLPDLFVANIETSQCTSPESKDLIFPDPGQSVVESPGAILEPPTGPNCGAGGPVDGNPNKGYPDAGTSDPGIPNPGIGEVNPGIPNSDAPNPGIPTPDAPSDGIPDFDTPNTGAPYDGSAGDDFADDGSNDIEVIPISPSLVGPPAQTQSSETSQVSVVPNPTSVSPPFENISGSLFLTAPISSRSSPVSSSVQSPAQSSAFTSPSTLLTVTTSSSVVGQPEQQQPTEANPVAPPTPTSSLSTDTGNDGGPEAGPDGSGTGSGGASGSCTGDGTMVCNGPSQFGLCNNGKVTWQAVAPGTRCEGGAIV